MLRARLHRIYRDSVPSREGLAGNRFIRPVAHRVLAPELWRFSRRSVPRGVALGLLVGIFLLIPGIQIAGAALLALPVRANIPLAAAMTFLSNPATTPFIVALALYIGNMMLGLHADVASFTALIERGAGLGEWMVWLVSDTAPALLFGLFVVSSVSAAIGYLVASWLWRVRLARRWAARAQRRADAAASRAG